MDRLATAVVTGLCDPMRNDPDNSLLSPGVAALPSAVFCVVYGLFLIGLQLFDGGRALLDEHTFLADTLARPAVAARPSGSQSKAPGNDQPPADLPVAPLPGEAETLAQVPARTDSALAPAKVPGDLSVSDKIAIQGIRFDLGASVARTDPGTAIDIRKPYLINGVDAGTTLVRVSADSRLSIPMAELRKIAPRLRQSRLADQLDNLGDDEFILLDAIREKGIQIRYDPTKDEIQFTG